MTALAQGCTGLALVLCFFLLRTRAAGVAGAILLAQSVAVAAAAIAMSRPEMAVAPLLLAGTVWAARQRAAAQGMLMPPVVGPRLGVLAGVTLTALSQSQGALALPLAIVLLGVLLATTRPHALMQSVALVVMQNGIVLAGCHAARTAQLPLACVLLPLPLVAMLAGVDPRPAWRFLKQRHARWIGLARVSASAAVFVATLIVPLDPLAAVFAPLLAFEGLLRAWAERRRLAKAPFGHAAAFVRLSCIVLAVATPDPFLGWIGILGAVAAALWPVLERCWPNAVLAICAAGVALLGLVMLQTGSPPIGFLAVFIGYAAIAACVPDVAVPLLALALRLSAATAWTEVAVWLATSVAVMALLVCASLLLRRRQPHRLALLHLAQASVAFLAIALNQPDGRYAALVLLILLTLTRAASRFGATIAGAIARAGLSGIPPLGVFPALILVALAFSAENPWLLLPLLVALGPMVPASLPTRHLAPAGRRGLLSLAWVPLGMAVAVGFFTPDSLSHWLHQLAVGPS